MASIDILYVSQPTQLLDSETMLDALWVNAESSVRLQRIRLVKLLADLR